MNKIGKSILLAVSMIAVIWTACQKEENDISEQSLIGTWKLFSKVGAGWTYELLESKGNLIAATDSGLYVSTNNGLSWIMTVDSVQFFSLCRTKDPTTILAGAINGVYRSTNSGLTWNYVNNGFPRAVVEDITVDSSDGYWAASLRGLFYSSDHGQNWESKGFSGGVTSILITSQQLIFVGNYMSDIVFSSDFGTTWETSLKDNAPFLKTFIQLGDSLILASVLHDSRIIRTTNIGRTWSTSDYWPAGVLEYMDMDSMVLAACGNIGILRSPDQGATWSEFNNGLDTLRMGCLEKFSESSILAGGIDGRIYRMLLE